MGLLSDPSLAPRRNFGKNLGKHTGKICFLFYIAGLAWFIVLALPDFNHGTYLSENALSPGLVFPEIKEDTGRLAQSLHDELKRERENHKSGIPYAWISAKMKQIGLETHVHNFTLRTPLGGGIEYQGKNVYGILRASGVGSTEGIVFSTSYRAPNSLYADISVSVPVLLAFADFARKRNYWAKDLVFLVTDQEQLGTEAWLRAYCGAHGEDVNKVLDAGLLPARAGSLQAALNLEIEDLDFDLLNVKIEGLNGQLPNLDLFNLVQRITVREAISSGYKHNLRKKRRQTKSKFEENLTNMLQMLLSQANGVPSGNHGLFNRYRIESLTLEATKRTGGGGNSNPRSSATALLKTIEGISRSLNNLLERFHQSFFFYILVQNDRYISIGDYIPALCLLAAPMFIKAFLLWLNELSENNDNATPASDANKDAAADNVTTPKAAQPVNYPVVLKHIGIALAFGLLSNALYWSEFLRDYIVLVNMNTSSIVGVFLRATVLFGAFMTYDIGLNQRDLKMLHIATLILLGDCLIVLGLMNFSLGYLVAIFCTPLTFLIDTASVSPLRTFLSKCYMVLLNPLVLAYAFVCILTLAQFPEMEMLDLLVKALYATTDAMTFAVVDNIIYGNWLFSVMSLALYPLWLLNWSIITTKPNLAA